MDSFLQQTAQSLIQSFNWGELHRITLVLPSHRAGLVLKKELLNWQKCHKAQAIWAPRVVTLTQLQDELSPLYAEDELMTIVRLYKLYRQTQKEEEAMPLDMFYGWGRQILADFTNIDASIPTAEEVAKFFDNTIAAHELEEWKLDEETKKRLQGLMGDAKKATSAESVKHHYEQLWQQLYTLYLGLRKEMQEAQKGYAGMRQRAVIDEWDSESVQKKIKGQTFVFVGYNYLLPVELELMKKLRAAGTARFYWDFVPEFKTNSKAFYFAEQNACDATILYFA